MKHFYIIAALSFIIGTSSCQSDVVEQTASAPTIHVEEAFPGQKGVAKSGYLSGQESKIEYQVVQNQNVFEADILLNNEQVHQFGEMRTNGTGRTSSFSRWANGVVPFVIDPTLPNQARITQAISHWSTNTKLRFVRRTTEKDYIVFRRGSGCSSYVGRIGGEQPINTGDGCTTGSIIHEIGHAVGLWHEQSRRDRDQHLIVRWSNMVAGTETNFRSYTELGMDGFDTSGGMDFWSIMMYPCTAFSKNGQPTLLRRNGTTFNVQRSVLSVKDREAITIMYPNLK
jgi:Astacin (Peptidase family M12A)